MDSVFIRIKKPPIFWNVQMSQNFQKNNCAFPTQIGSIVTYTVPSNKYSSLISQADANQKAQNDINANGQAYANANGTCDEKFWTTAHKNGCIHLWEFNDNYNDTIGNFHLSQNNPGAVWFTNGKMRRSAVFGSGYLYHNAQFPILNNWTISFWMKFKNGTPNVQGIIHRMQYGNSCGLRIVGSRFRLNTMVPVQSGGAAVQAGDSNLININTWFYFTYVGSGSMYVNGQYTNSTTYYPFPNLTAPFYIGVDDTDFSRLLQADVEQLAVWNRNLTTTEINELYNDGLGRNYN